jgi:hypothetical protein
VFLVTACVLASLSFILSCWRWRSGIAGSDSHSFKLSMNVALLALGFRCRYQLVSLHRGPDEELIPSSNRYNVESFANEHYSSCSDPLFCRPNVTFVGYFVICWSVAPGEIATPSRLDSARPLSMIVQPSPTSYLGIACCYIISHVARIL